MQRNPANSEIQDNAPSSRANGCVSSCPYERHEPDLGLEFLHELDRLLSRITENPQQFPEIEASVRRGLLRRFPFALYFLTKATEVEIIAVIAVLHHHRSPETWRGRT